LKEIEWIALGEALSLSDLPLITFVNFIAFDINPNIDISNFF
jgi:hypothetical protein